MDSQLPQIMDEYVEDLHTDQIDYREESEKYLNMDRWIGDDPILLVIDAVATSTGMAYVNTRKQVEEFDSRINSAGTGLEDIAQMSVDDEVLKDVFPFRRKREAIVDISKVISEMEGDGVDALRHWAENADPYEYEDDPVGEINGIGLRTFQFLRMVSGVDTVKPDVQVKKFLKEISAEYDAFEVEYDDPSDIRDIEALRLCERLATETKYSLIEIDQIAWWTFSEGE